MTLEAERMVLGAVIVTNTALADAQAILRRADFESELHRQVWEAMLTLDSRSEPIDLVSLNHQLAGRVEAAYLGGLLDGVPRVASVGHWAGIVRDSSKRRTLRAIGERLATSVDSEESVDALTERVIVALEKLTRAEDSRTVVHMREAVQRAHDRLDEFSRGTGITGVPSGIERLDLCLSGFQPGHLVVIAARPGAGKSTLLSQAIVFAGKAGFKCLAFCMEMPPEAVAERALISEAQVERWKLKTHTEAQWQAVASANVRLSGLPVWFDKRETVSIGQVRATAKRHKVVHGLDLLAIDYLQRMELPEGTNMDQNWLGVGINAQSLKSLSMALQVPVLAACQLSRAAENREPTLADLAQSGHIERESDVVILLHPDQETKRQALQGVKCIVAKHRPGATDEFPLSFQKALHRFVEESEFQTSTAEWR